MEWKTEVRKIEDLSFYIKNPRGIKRDQADHLQESLSKFGQCEDIVINTNNLVIGGHQRIRMLKRLGKKYAQVKVPDREMDDKEVEELNIRLNKNTGFFDDEMLANAWELDDLRKWGFTDRELEIDGMGEEPKAQSFNLSIKFQEKNHLQEAEDKISMLLEEYDGATYKVKVK